jgi:hypothetical protein
VVSSGGRIASIFVGRTVTGGVSPDAVLGAAGDSSGAVYAFGSLGSVTIVGNVGGGGGDFSGSIGAHGLIGSVTVSGDLRGSDGSSSGSINALDENSSQTPGAIGKVVVGGDVVGALGVNAGSISSDGAIRSVKLGGLLAGSEPRSGLVVAGAGLFGAGNIGPVDIAAFGRAEVMGANPPPPANGGTVLAYGSVGSLTAGQIFNGTIHVADSLGAVTVAGDMVGGIVTAGGQAVFNGKSDLAIASLVVKGDVASSTIMAGYSVTGSPANGHAQIGSVQVTGDWSASDLVAGVANATGNFGTSADTLIENSSSSVLSRIASIVIGGSVTGSADANDHFGFVARQIGSFRSGAGKLALDSTAGQVFELTADTTNDVTVREVVPV